MIKRLLIILIIPLVIVFSCQFGGSKKIDSDCLQGRYEVNMMALIEGLAMKMSQQEGIAAERVRSLSGLAGQTVSMEFHFLRGRKGRVKLDAGVFDAVTDARYSYDKSFAYELREDSIIFWQPEDQVAMSPLGIIRKVSDDYRNLTLLVLDQEFMGRDTVFFDMKKISN